MKEAFDIVKDCRLSVGRDFGTEVHLLVADVSSLMEDAALQDELLHTLSPQRRAKVEAMGNRRVRALSIGVTLLLDCLLQEQGLCEKVMNYEVGEHGKPLDATRRVVFNLSHSGRMAAAATLLVAPEIHVSCSLGIDIQRITRYRPALVRRIFSDTQREQLAACTDELCRQQFFAQMWCRGEAYAKATGDGLRWPFPVPESNAHFMDFEVGENYCGALCTMTERT